MATKTDLDGFLRNDAERNVMLKLADWLSTVPKREPPITLRARWTPSFASSSEKVGEVKSSTPDASAASNMIDHLYEQVVERLGSNPDGTLRIQIYAKGGSGDVHNSGINMQARIVPMENLTDDPNLALVREENRRLTRQNMEMHAMVVGAFQHQSVVLVEQSRMIAQLGTMRAVAAAGAESASGGIMQIVGLGFLIMAFPVAKKQLGLEPTATIDEVLDRLRVVMMRGPQAHKGDREQDAVSGGADLEPPALPYGSTPGESNGRGADAPAQLEGPQDGAPDVAAMIAAMLEDPAVRERVFAGIADNKELSEAALSAYMGK